MPKPTREGSAIIGHTGFVGGILKAARPFDALFNSTDIETIRHRHFARLVCAGVSAVKWQANANPAQDWHGITRLIAALETIRVDRFVLISTIDVYREPWGKTEDYAPQPADLHAYGRHRLFLEAFIRHHFPGALIVRLPALFGTGLKKNAVYDLLHANQTEKIPANASLQWYPMARLADDLDRIDAAGLDLINITSAPLTMAEIRDRFFPGAPLGPTAATPPHYDLHSRHDTTLSGRNGYHLDREQVLAALAAFIEAERATP